MDKAEAEGDIFVVLGSDQRHAIGVPLDPDLDLWPGHHDPTIDLRQRRAEIQVEPAAEDDQQRQETGPDTADDVRPGPRASGLLSPPRFVRQRPSSRRILSRSASRSGAGERVGGSVKSDSCIGLPASLSGPETGSSTETT